MFQIPNFTLVLHAMNHMEDYYSGKGGEELLDAATCETVIDILHNITSLSEDKIEQSQERLIKAYDILGYTEKLIRSLLSDNVTQVMGSIGDIQKACRYIYSSYFDQTNE